MKNKSFTILPLAFLLFLICGFSHIPRQRQFEGVITYDIKLIDKNASTATMARMRGMYGNQLKLYIKGKYFKEEYYENSTLLRTVYYVATEQKAYVQKVNAATIEPMEVSKENFVLSETKNMFDKVDILNTQCRTFIYAAQAPDVRVSPNKVVAGKTALYRYLYPLEPQYSIHEELYAGYKLGFRENYFRRFNTLFMSYEYEDDEVMLSLTAAEIAPQKLDEALFTVPKPAPQTTAAPAPSGKAGSEPLNQQNATARKSGHE